MSDLGISGINNAVTNFSTGAVRDIQENKGRCDLMPLSVIGDLYGVWRAYCYRDELRTSEISFNTTNIISNILRRLGFYVYHGNTGDLHEAICLFIILTNKSIGSDDEIIFADKTFIETMLEVSMHYKNGTVKYGERNWEKGIPLHSYIDSATRHFLKYIGGYDDERHDLAFIWNLLCCIHTQLNISKDELMDLPFCTDAVIGGNSE